MQVVGEKETERERGGGRKGKKEEEKDSRLVLALGREEPCGDGQGHYDGEADEDAVPVCWAELLACLLF